MRTEQSSFWQRDSKLLFFILVLFFCIGLAARPYLTPSEARYIEIPRQILATSDWLTPYINGVPYFEKPPLFYWMQASVMGLLGLDEFSGRLVSVIVLSALCVLTCATARQLYGRTAGLLAAVMLATSVMGYGLSRVAGLDATVTLFITGTLSCFLAAQKTPNNRHRRSFYLSMYVSAALAVMTKGLIGIVIPGLVIGAWIAATKQWRILREAQLIPGLILFLIIAAPWHVMMAHAHPDFLNFYFIHEHFTRYLTEEHKRVAPWWFFIAVTIAGLIPWSGLLPFMAKRLQWKEPTNLLLVLWIILPLIFFSSSHSKLTPYIFPIFPPLCILLGEYLASIWRAEVPTIELRRATWFIVVLFAAAAVIFHAIPNLSGKAAQKLTSLDAVTPEAIFPLAVMIAALALTCLRKRGPQAITYLLIGFGATLGLTLNYLAASLDNETIKPLTDQLIPDLQKDDMVMAYGSYWQDLPVYLNRNVIVAGWTGELGFGVEHYPETRAWMIDEKDFWPRCASSPYHVYVFMEKATFDHLPPHADCPLKEMAAHGRTVLLMKETP